MTAGRGVAAITRTRLRLPARRRVQGWVVGDHPSVHKGRSADYDDVHQYQPGDDVRDVDWNASARAGSIVTRRHVAENVQRLLLVVDTAAAMRVVAAGGDDKAAIASACAAALGSAALGAGDLVGLVAGDTGTMDVEPARRGRHQVESVLRRLAPRWATPAGGGALARLLDQAGRSSRRQLVAVVTDERPLDDDVVGALRRLRLRHDVVWITVADADLVDGSFGAGDLVDIELGDALPGPLRDDADLVAEYYAEAAAVAAARRRTLRRLVIPAVEIASLDAVIGRLAALLEQLRRA